MHLFCHSTIERRMRTGLAFFLSFYHREENEERACIILLHRDEIKSFVILLHRDESEYYSKKKQKTIAKIFEVVSHYHYLFYFHLLFHHHRLHSHLFFKKKQKTKANIRVRCWNQ